MTIQIIGTKKCKKTKKAKLFFQDRAIKFQFIDLNEKELSPGEWEKVFRAANEDELLDTESQIYKKKGMAWMDFDAKEELIENPLLLNTPLVRNSNNIAVGLDKELWQKIADEEK